MYSNLLKIHTIFCMLTAISIFVSVAVGNIFLALSVLTFFSIIYYKRQDICFCRLSNYKKRYVKVILFFILTMLISAVCSGDILKGVQEWISLCIWRFVPIFILLFLPIYNEKVTKEILFCTILGFIIATIPVIYQGLNGNLRAEGLYNNPLYYGGLLTIFIPPLIVFSIENIIDNKFRLFCFIGMILSFMALYFNGSRGSWVALFPIILCLLGYYAKKSTKVLIASLILLSFSSIYLFNNQHFINKIQSITSTTNESNNERILIWSSAFNMFVDHPIMGVGLGQYHISYTNKYVSPLAINPTLSHAHNNIMQMLAENGLLGCIGFITMFGYFIVNNVKIWMKTNNPYALAIFTATIAYMLQGLTEYNFGNNSVILKSYWLFLGTNIILSSFWMEKYSARKNK